jgi:biotin carboxylase
MTAMLIGASPFGSAALGRLGIPFVLIVEPSEDPSRVSTKPLEIVELPYAAAPTSIVEQPSLFQGRHIEAVLSFTEYGLLPAALTAEVLGLRTPSIASVIRTRNKLIMRRSLAGFASQPAFGLLTVEEIERLPYPLVVKPVDGVSSRSVEYVDDVAHCRELASRQGTWMFESYVDGPEFSIEAVSFARRHTILGITEKSVAGRRCFAELRHIADADSAQRYREVGATVARCLDALGIQFGATHTEVRVVGGEVFIIETHTRPAGERIPRITELVSGYDQYELAIRAVLGMKLPPRPPAKYQSAGSKFLEWRPGIFKAVDRAEECAAHPGVEEVAITATEGDSLSEWRSNDDRPGFIVVGGQSREDVVRKMIEIEEMMTVHYQPQSTTDRAGGRAL